MIKKSVKKSIATVKNEKLKSILIWGLILHAQMAIPDAQLCP